MKVDQNSLMNQKQVALMSLAMQKILDGTFDEADVRFLLLGVREIAKFYVEEFKCDQAGPKFLAGLPLLLEICHGIAHPELKDRGPLRDYVKNSDQFIAKSWSKMTHQKLISTEFNPSSGKFKFNLKAPPALKPLPIYATTLAFVTILGRIFPETVSDHRVVENMRDIALCIVSTLHLMQMPLWDDDDTELHIDKRRVAIFALHSWQERYHLYASVRNSAVQKYLDGKSEKENPDPAPNVFTAFEDVQLMRGGVTLDIAKPEVVVARRCSDGRLRLEKIHRVL